MKPSNLFRVSVKFFICTLLFALPAVYAQAAQQESQTSVPKIVHKTVSADAGIPNCFVLGHTELMPQHPSEEHLPLEISANTNQDAATSQIGETLYLVPKHVCPTVNNFDHAIIVESGHITGVERVTARGREVPITGV